MIKWIYISRDRPTVKILYEIWYVNASTTELRVVCTEQVHSLTSFEVILTGVIWHSVSLNLYLEQVIVTNLVKNFLWHSKVHYDDHKRRCWILS